MLLQNVQDEFAEVINTDGQNTNIVMPSENMLIYRNNMISSLISTLDTTK